MFFFFFVVVVVFCSSVLLICHLCFIFCEVLLLRFSYDKEMSTLAFHVHAFGANIFSLLLSGPAILFPFQISTVFLRNRTIVPLPLEIVPLI